MRPTEGPRAARAAAARVTLSALFALSLGHASPARGEGAAWLTVERRPGAERCPGAAELRAAVIRQIGRDPFDPAGLLRLRCTFFRSAAGLEARIESWEQGAEEKTRQRPFRPVRGGCDELGALVAFSLAVTLPEEIDAATAAAEAPAPAVDAAPEAPEAAGEVAAAAVARVPATTPLRALPVRPWLQLSALAGTGLLPRASLGLGALGGMARGGLALAAELRAERSLDRALPAGELRSFRIAAAVLPCLSLSGFGGCVVGRGGLLRATQGGSGSATAPVAEAGVRLFVRLAAPGERRVELAAEALAPLLRPRLIIAGEPAWTAPRFGAALVLSWLLGRQALTESAVSSQ